MSNIILIFLSLSIGWALRRFSNFPKNTPAVLNQYIIYVALPAMALYHIPKIKLSSDLLYPLAVAWIAFGISYIIFTTLGKKFGWSRRLIGCLILTGGLGNTSFVGIPIVSALYGKEGIQTLIIVDLPGTFVVLSTLGVLVANMYSNQKEKVSYVKKIFTFPPLVAFLVALMFSLLSIDFPEALSETFKVFAATISPLALISVGYQLRFQKESKHYPYLLLGLMVQLVITPLVIFGLYYGVFGKTDLATKVCIIEAAMAPMITAAILASNYGLKPQLSNMMVGFGIPLSFVTISMWYFLIEFFVK